MSKEHEILMSPGVDVQPTSIKDLVPEMVKENVCLSHT